MAGYVRLVRNEQDGESVFPVQPLEDRHDFGARPRIERAGRLIRQQNDGVLHQRPRNRDALLLAAGQLDGAVAVPVTQPNGIERPLGPRPRVPPAAIQERELDVRQRGEPRQQVVGLEDEPNLVVAGLGELGVAPIAPPRRRPAGSCPT